MSHYTKVNLWEVEDMAPRFGLGDGLQSRFAREPLELEQSGLSIYRIAPDFRLPFGHAHSEQEEIYLVVSGAARVKIDDEVVELGPWDAVRIPAGAMRSFEGGPDGAELLAFGAPSHGNQDAELQQDWWSD